MKRLMLLILAVGLFLPSLLHAQAMRTWVSGTGADTNPCTRLAPCRTFAAAYANTPAGGEIVALDGGGFGPLTITHAITIDGGGQFAGVIATVTSPVSFDIYAGLSDTVVLRNLSIDGFGIGNWGIGFGGGGNLIVENCTIHDFAYDGITFFPSSASSSLVVRDSSIYRNNVDGVQVGAGYALLDNVHLNGNCVGLEALSKADVWNSVAEGNQCEGFTACVDSQNYPCSDYGPGDLNVVHSLAVDNSYGVFQGNGIVRLSDVLFSHNGVALDMFEGGTAYTYGDNEVDGNSNNSFSATLIPKH